MSKNTGKLWTKDELLLAINLYCKTSYGKIHSRNPEIINLAVKLGRSPGAVSYKLLNFASIDTSQKGKGADHCGKLDKEVWNEFFGNMETIVYESEKEFSDINGNDSRESVFDLDETIIGKSVEVITKNRVNQYFFRRMILSSYNNTCCITGIFLPELLIAGHIVPWSIDKENRLNPMNGLCLNALHDRAFDKGLISISDDYRVMVSPILTEKKDTFDKHALITRYEGEKIMLPNRFLPGREFLAYHRENIFKNENI